MQETQKSSLVYTALQNVVLWYKPLSRSVITSRFPNLFGRTWEWLS